MNRVCLLLVFLCAFACVSFAGRIPVIIDTDIGSAPDDPWAIALLLVSEEVDIKLIVTATGNTTERAQVLAQFLTSVGRSDIPIALGVGQGEGLSNEYAYGKNFNLAEYPGGVHQDGIQAMIDVIHTEPFITYLELAPSVNFAELASRRPKLIEGIRVVEMGGSINKGYYGRPYPEPEYNIYDNITASQALYNFTFHRVLMTTAPLDTAGTLAINGTNYQRLLEKANSNILVSNLFDMYQAFLSPKNISVAEIPSTSILYDVVAAALVYSVDHLTLETLPISVNATGFTVVDETFGNNMLVATSWISHGRTLFNDDVTNRYLMFNSSFL